MGRGVRPNAVDEDDDLPWWTMASSPEQKARYRKAQAELEASENVRRAKQGLKPRTEAQDVYNRSLARAGNKPLAPVNKARTRPAPVMGSNENITEYPSVMSGRGTMPGMPAPKITTRRDTTARDTSKRNDGMDVTYGPLIVPRKTVEYDSGTLNPSEFGPATMGPMGGRAAPVMGSNENIDVSRIGQGGFEASPMPMRRGLFGEEISQEDWDAMTQRNKDAGFYGRFKKGGSVKKKPAKKMAKGGSVSSASKRADGCAQRGKTKGRMV